MHRRVCLGNVPILTLHSVRRHATESLGELTLPEDVFESLLVSLKVAGYQSIRCGDLFAHLEHGKALPDRPVLLSFDDGYLDNHTIAAPLLRKHGFSATVFVATSMLHADEVVRPTTEEIENPPERGFLSPAEIQKCDADGVLEFQSHTHSHDRIASSPLVEDFHRPELPCWWLRRSRMNSQERAAEETVTDLGRRLSWGAPVRTSAWACEGTWFQAEDSQEKALSQYVEASGGADFFAQADWREQLHKIVEDNPAQGTYETLVERKIRVLREMTTSKSILENILGRQVSFVAWPGGAMEAHALQWAIQEAGYQASFGTNRSCEGVPFQNRAIPRAYFRQNYRGHGDRWLRAQLARGILDWEAGRCSGYFRSFAVRRLMRILRNPAMPNQPRKT